ncbi:MAG: nitroreductase family protein [Bacteroidales bacterium]|nr:nitroreductase family protein [Bacteroidales bacterium]
MKTRNILIAVLAILLGIAVILIILFAQTTKKEIDIKEEIKMEEQDFTKVIFERKSVRNYTEAAVEKEKLEKLMRAGMAAPSARNLQPWEFIAVTERSILDEMADGLPYCKMLTKAPAAIIVCGNMEKAATDVDKSYWVQDCAAASQNILLAAEATGLGAVWTAAFPYQERMDVVIKTLNLPEHIIPLNVIPVGYPTGKDKAKDKFKPENIHWEKW